MRLSLVLTVFLFVLPQENYAQFQYPLTFGQDARVNPLDFVRELSHLPLQVSHHDRASSIFRQIQLVAACLNVLCCAATTPLSHDHWRGSQESSRPGEELVPALVCPVGFY